ncbi:hydrolase [Rhizobiales bacterium RZME27]|uniref:Hydrolase n=1 Tax=Endobacterium cereale TaxID=2663029 RepID=A0A6A8A8W7_9HYPH|nr:dienelactone hydrolase family protein [Endobacterium cereale]MEB2846370.1 dienelactone hydrolase family protein [Endobacterium cereale]MQY46337.1 hydrolase [Endobacterium cereale]
MIDAENMCGISRRLRDRNHFVWNFDPEAQDFQAWRSKTREKVRLALGVDEVPPPISAIVSEWSDDDILGQELRLGFSNGETTLAYLLRPKTAAPAPAVLLLHDHGSFFSIGKEKLSNRSDENPELRADIDLWVNKLYGGRFIGNELVRRGYTVLCADALGWGSRRGNGYETQQALAANLMQFGVSYASVILSEDLEALAFLRNLPGVDKTRIASLGYSMGGLRAWQLAALSDDIAACVSGGWMGTLQGLMQPGNNQLRGQSAFTMLHPQIAGKLDYPHFAGLAAPKPALIFTGSEDRHFPQPVAEEAFQQLHGIWGAAEAPEQLETCICPGGHNFSQKQQDHAFDWLDRNL